MTLTYAERVDKLIHEIENNANTLTAILYESEDVESLDLNTKADLGYLLGKAARTLDEMRKAANRRRDIISRQTFEDIVARSVNDPTLEIRASGNYGMAIPQESFLPTLPKAGEPEYATMMEHFGVKNFAITAKLVTPHWKHIQEYLNDQFDPSGELPTIPGLRGLHPNPSCKFYANKKGTK